MITFTMQLPKVTLTFAENIGGESMALEIFSKGEHQDEPSHRYYKPDIKIHTTLTKGDIQQLGRFIDLMS